MGRFADTFLNWAVMAQYAPRILEGTWVTIRLALAVAIAGIACGLFLSVLRAFRFRAINVLIVFAVDVLRALPPLVIIIAFYFALPTVGVRMSAWVSTWLALSLVLMAFSEEIFWAGILAVPRGQWEAARSTGLSFLQTLRDVVLPQAVRLTIPPLTNRTIAITKNTALGAVVAVGEILYQAQSAYSFSYNPSPLLLMLVAYGLPFLVIRLGAFGSVALAFFLNTSSYYGEILRAGIESVPRGQLEAARSTGLSALQTMAWVVLPQAVRNVVPDLISNTLEVIKLTSIASVVALPELLHAAREAQALTYNATPIIAAGIIYLVCLWPLVRLLSRFEHRQIALH